MATTIKKNSDKSADAAVHFNAKGKAAIHNEAQVIIANGKQAVAKLRPHIAAYRNDKTYADNAKAILEAVRAEVNAYREPRGDKVMAPVRDQRASEFKACILMADWQCCDTVLDYFADTAMTDGDLLALARHLQAEVGKREKAPTRDALWAVVIDRRKNKTGRATGADGAVIPGKPKPINAGKAIDDANKLVTGWRAWIDAQPALKKRRVEANNVIGAFLKAASDLALLAKTAA